MTDATPAVPRRLSPPFLAATAACTALAMLWRWSQHYPLPLFDLYPLYYGALAWLRTGDAYALAAVVPPEHEAYNVLRIGGGYPLPAVLLALPLTLLPPHLAATLWVGGLTAGLLLALRLYGAPLWLLLYVPVIEGLRLEQYTVLVVVFQILALWALRERRPRLLALLCALILTKPTQGALFVLLMLYLGRNWREQLVAAGVVWGGSLLLDPNWVAEWLASLQGYVGAARQPVPWPLVLLALPLLLTRDMLGAALVAQLALAPFPYVYAAGALPLGVLHDPRSRWLSVASFVWPAAALLGGTLLATALTLVLPLVALSLLRWRERWTGHPVEDADAHPQ